MRLEIQAYRVDRVAHGCLAIGQTTHSNIGDEQIYSRCGLYFLSKMCQWAGRDLSSFQPAVPLFTRRDSDLPNSTHAGQTAFSPSTFLAHLPRLKTGDFDTPFSPFGTNPRTITQIRRHFRVTIGGGPHCIPHSGTAAVKSSVRVEGDDSMPGFYEPPVSHDCCAAYPSRSGI